MNCPVAHLGSFYFCDLLVLTPLTFGDCPPGSVLFCSRGAWAG